MDNSSDSDYVVEHYVKPDCTMKIINDESADILGNFDDKKRTEIFNGVYVDDSEREIESDDNTKEFMSESDNLNVEQLNSDKKIENPEPEEENGANRTVGGVQDNQLANDDKSGPTTILTKEQVMRLRRGTKKADRYVLYVTNLNFQTPPGILKDYFNTVGKVRSIRIPKRKRGGFAFVEMDDLDSYQRAFDLHNTELMGRQIRVQYSEAGKKKSANKKNILKQKNRKLAELRHENKLFTKSGKFYDKALKKLKAKEILLRKRWRKPLSNK